MLITFINGIRRSGYPLVVLDSVIYKPDENRIVDIYLDRGSGLIGRSTRVFSRGQAVESTTDEWLVNQDVILEKTGDLLEDWTDNGYPFVQVKVEPRNLRLINDSLSVDIDYIVNPGGFYRIGNVEFPGRRWTHRNILRLESRLKRGKAFSGGDLDRAVEGIERLEYISWTGVPVLRRESTGVIAVYIPIQEKKVNQFTGIAALQPQSNEVSGEVDVQLGNILGTGRKLSFTWRGLNPDRRIIEINYREPWLFKKPFYGELGFSQSVTDTLGSSVNFSLKLGWEPSINLDMELMTAYERIESDSLTESDWSSQTIWGGLGVILDYRDQSWNPSRGYSLNLESALGLSRNSITGNYRQRLIRESMDIEVYYPMSSKSVFAGKISAEDVSGNRIELEELARISGYKAVRGYPDERSLGRGITWSSMELRWRPDRNSYLGLFFDGGVIYRKDSRLQGIETDMLSFGITGGFTVPVGIFSIDVGLAQGEPINRARLHFRLINRF